MSDQSATRETPTIIGNTELAKFLTKSGYPLSRNTINKFTSTGKGPPHKGWWGKRRIFMPEDVLQWARARSQVAPTPPGRGRRKKPAPPPAEPVVEQLPPCQPVLEQLPPTAPPQPREQLPPTGLDDIAPPQSKPIEQLPPTSGDFLCFD